MAIGLTKLFDQETAVGFDDAARRHVIRIRGQVHKLESFLFDFGQQKLQSASRIASATFPWNDGVADVTEAVWRQGARTGLPPESNHATEFAIPHPSSESRQSRDGHAVRKN